MCSRKKKLRQLQFMRLDGGDVQMGTRFPTPCDLEGVRKNELPKRVHTVDPFWVSMYCVSNIEFEQFNSDHHRPPVASNDKSPVVDVTYLDAVKYAEWLSKLHGVEFRLPTEDEWSFAAAPFGWEHSFQKGIRPREVKAHTYDPNHYYTLDVDDDRFGANVHGLYHMSGNIFEMTNGWYYAPGHNGAETDGAYCIIKGGSFGHCWYGARVACRGMMDVTGRSTRIGFRLVHSV